MLYDLFKITSNRYSYFTLKDQGLKHDTLLKLVVLLSYNLRLYLFIDFTLQNQVFHKTLMMFYID